MSHIDNAKAELELAFEAGEFGETDTRTRALARAGFVLGGPMYDQPVDETETTLPLQDAFTDLIHWAETNGIDVGLVFGRARFMYQQEQAEWPEGGSNA